jgi:predicted RNase H-like nuclease
VVEVHPELSFRRLDPRVVESKRTARGLGQRIRALAGPYDIGDLAELPPGVPLVDALDALAAAWSAARHRAGAAEVLGGDRDGRGLRMEIRV